MPRKRLERNTTSFDKTEYENYIRNWPGRTIAAQCNLWVMANLVRDSLPEYAERAYDVLHRCDVERQTAIEDGISSRQIFAKIERSMGRAEVAGELEAEASYGRKTLTKIQDESRPKILGALHGKALPGGLLYLALLEEYIAVKIGKKATPVEVAQIVSALLAGLERLQDAGINPVLLKKKLEQFRKRNPSLVEEMKRITQQDSSGTSLLERKYGKAFIADRI